MILPQSIMSHTATVKLHSYLFIDVQTNFNKVFNMLQADKCNLQYSAIENKESTSCWRLHTIKRSWCCSYFKCNAIYVHCGAANSREDRRESINAAWPIIAFANMRARGERGQQANQTHKQQSAAIRQRAKVNSQARTMQSASGR